MAQIICSSTRKQSFRHYGEYERGMIGRTPYFLCVKNTTTRIPARTTRVASTAMVAIMLALVTPSPPPPMDFHPSRREPADPSSRLMASGSNTQSRPTCSQIPLSVHMEATPLPPDLPEPRGAELAFVFGAAAGRGMVSVSAMFLDSLILVRY